MSIKQYKHRSTNHNGYPNTVYHLFIYSIYVKTDQELPHGRQQSNTMPTWATSVKKHCPSRFSLETHCKDTSSLYSKTCSLTIRRAWDLNKSSQVSSDAATSSRGTDAGVGQGASGNCRGDHGTIGSPDEPERMWVSVPSGSIDESMSAVSGSVRIQR